MTTIKYDTLDTDYLQTDGTIPVAIPDTGVQLAVTNGYVAEPVSLENYSKIAVIFENDNTINVDYVELLGNQETTATLEVVPDSYASSGYALKLTGAQTLVFGTKISYIPNILKRITCKAKKDASNTTEKLYVSVVAYKNGIYNGKSSTDLHDYVKACMDGTEDLGTTNYTTVKGYIKGTDTTFTEPALLPDNPTAHPPDTEDIALIIETTGGIFYIDVISLEEVENTIREIPDGLDTYNNANIVVTTAGSLGLKTNVSNFEETPENGSAYLFGYTVGEIPKDIPAKVKYNGVNVSIDNQVIYGIANKKAYIFYDVSGNTSPSAITAYFDASTNAFYERRLSVVSAGDTTSVLAVGTGTGVLSAGYADYNIETTYPTATWVQLGYIEMDDTAITNSYLRENVFDVQESKYDQLRDMFRHLATDDPIEFKARAEAMGVDNVFTSLAAYEAFINVLYVKYLEVVDGDFSLKSNASDGLAITKNGVNLFGVDPATGDVTIGNYNPTTNSGGIFYDKSADKLLGNVAYNQWDLVVESDEDLAKLATGTDIYRKVLITEGTYGFTSQLDLEAHGVEVFVGVSKEAILSVNFLLNSTVDTAIKCGSNLVDFGLLSITTNQTLSPSAGYHIILVNDISTTNFHDIHIYGFNRCWIGIARGVFANDKSTIQRCLIEDTSYGFLRMNNLSNCFTDGTEYGYYSCQYVVNCTSINNTYDGFVGCSYVTSIRVDTCGGNGFSHCSLLSQCSANNCTNYGFRNCNYVNSSGGQYNGTAFFDCKNLTNCADDSSIDVGFDHCYYLSSCKATLSPTLFYYCNNISSSVANGAFVSTYGFDNCSYISSSIADNCTTDWNACTKVDSDSCNNI